MRYVGEVFNKFGNELPGIKCLWVDEFIAYETDCSYTAQTFVILQTDQFQYDSLDRDGHKYYRRFDTLDDAEQVEYARIKRTILGPVLIVKSRTHE